MTARINDLFGDLALDKPITVEVDGRELELDMRVEDLHAFMSMGQTQEVSEDDVEKLTDALRNILYRSYLPHYDRVRDQERENLSDQQQEENQEAKEYIEGLLLRHYLDVFMGITEELGWQEDMQNVPETGNFPENPQS